MSKLNVLVLMGGSSYESEVSLASGREALKFLDRDKYNVSPAIISNRNDWLVNERIVSKESVLQGINIVFNALHGGQGEDGRLQGFLDVLGVSYTGSGVLASALAMDKQKSKRLLRYAGLNTSRDVCLDKCPSFFESLQFKNLLERFMPPAVVKPVSCGSSIGVKFAHNTKELKIALEEAFKYDSRVLIEELIEGEEVTCGVLENWADEEIYALPPIRIKPLKNSLFFDYNAKYQPEYVKEEIINDWPGPLIKEIQQIAKIAHRALNCRGYSRTDMIVKRFKDQRKPALVCVLELNTLPGLTKNSLFPKAARAIGLDMPALLDHLIKLGLENYDAKNYN